MRDNISPTFATTTITGDNTLGTNSILYNSDALNQNELSNTSEQEEEEQKHKMKLVLGTKISKVKKRKWI